MKVININHRVPRKIKKKILKLKIKELLDFTNRKTLKYWSYSRFFYIGFSSKNKKGIGLFKRQ